MLKLSWTMTLRDWRAGELRFLIVALALAVASLSAVQFFSARMGAALERDAHQLLGADLRVNAEAPIDAALRERALHFGLRAADTIELQSMAIAGEGAAAHTRMVALKAVSPGYPLRGKLLLRDGRAASAPAPGTAWVDASLLAQLQLHMGAQIRLGERRFTIAAVIAREPDRGPAALAIAPRVMIAMADLEPSGLLQPGAIAGYSLLLSGDADQQARYTAWFKTAAPKGMDLDTLASSNAATSEALGRAQQFLSLIGLLSAMLASVAVAMAARRFMLRHLDACAMLRCLGMPHARVTTLFALELLLVGLAGSALGVALGYGAHFLLLDWLGTLVGGELAPLSWLPAVRGIAVGVLLLAGFGLPPLLQMRAIPHNRLLRREAAAPRALTLAGAGIGVTAFGALLVWQAGDPLVGALAAAAFGIGLAGFSGVAWAALRCLRWLPAALERGVWRLALADMRRNPGAAIVRVVALALGLMALLLLTVVRGDLLTAWNNTAPSDAPNHAIFNIQPEQRVAIAARLQAHGQPQLYPSSNGRLLALNGKPLSAAGVADERAKRLIERYVDVSSTGQLAVTDTLVQGRWFAPGGGAPELSVSEGTAKALAIKLGDVVTIDFAGQTVSAPVTSVRKIDWRSRRPVFSFILNPVAARGLPASYLAALHVPAQDGAFIDSLTQDYPNLTIIDIGAVLAQFQRVLDQVSAAVQFLFLFTLASGLLVLYITLASSQDERTRQAAVLRALGASRAQLARAQWLEFAVTGALAGLLAAGGATAAGWALARFAFKLEWHFSPVLWLAGLLAGALCALAGGWAGLRAVLNHAPLQSLRTH
ncbi:MAG: FtsX-like permease family protein [Pseudomonadota bacterium]